MSDQKPRVKDFMTNLEYAELLLAVRAKMTSDKQKEFYTSMEKGFNDYGGSAFLSDKQKSFLEKVRDHTGESTR